MKDIIDLLARVFISLIFFFEAYESIKFFDLTKDVMTSFGITWRQDLLLGGAIAVLILGGILILIGYRSSFGAILLLIYIVPVTFIAYSWWNDPSPERRDQSVIFMKNIAIIGGLLLVYVNGSGKYSVRRLFATTRVPSAK